MMRSGRAADVGSQPGDIVVRAIDELQRYALSVFPGPPQLTSGSRSKALTLAIALGRRRRVHAWSGRDDARFLRLGSDLRELDQELRR